MHFMQKTYCRTVTVQKIQEKKWQIKNRAFNSLRLLMEKNLFRVHTVFMKLPMSRLLDQRDAVFHIPLYSYIP